MVPPQLLCRSHLLGEHRELHALVGIIASGKSLTGYAAKNLIDTALIPRRHDDLVAEMLARGYRHHSPLNDVPDVAVGHVDALSNLQELRKRCAGCKERIEMRPKIGDRVRMVGIMPNDPAPLPVGLEGTVTDVTPPEWSLQQYTVDWDRDDSGARRSLMLLPGDPFVIINQAAAPTQP